MNKTQAIQNFLQSQPYDIGKLYTSNMEVQVNVAKDEGEPINGEYQGKKWHGYTDGLNIWKPFRIPFNADSAPTYTDTTITFDLSRHVEAIGMTGWDWVNKKSCWVAFDFDSIVGHKKGLTQGELDDIKNKLSAIDFVYLYSSTSGDGLHVYVYISSDLSVETHTEHAALARAILAKISSLSGISLEARVDTLGGNMWVWHRKAKPERSYKLLKQGIVLTSIPTNWRDYLNVVQTKKLSPTKVDDIVAAKQRLELTQEHVQVLRWLETSNSLWWFDETKQMLVCHTHDLKRCHQQLKLRGIFETIATGKDAGHDQNCFAFPSNDGSWTVRRHSRGCQEHFTWFIDSSGWTTTYFNKAPSLRLASLSQGGSETEKNYFFRTLEEAAKALILLGIDCPVPQRMISRPATIEELKNNKIRISFERSTHDEQLLDWIEKKKTWERYFYYPKLLDDIDLPDQLLRHVISGESAVGWFIYTNNSWINEARHNIVSVLLSKGFKQDKIDSLLGLAISHNWALVNKPFQLEYPGNREWNKNAAQLKFKPVPGEHPTWDKIFEHCGEYLNEFTGSGKFYLQTWCASLFQCPLEPLPYLFFIGNQNTGKSIFHEALCLLFSTGYTRADNALNNASSFNGELANSVLCIVEETNLGKKGPAFDRIKDWVTGKTINIHTKGKTPYLLPNSTHWIQCANLPEYCPIFSGDTRITAIEVKPLVEEIPKFILLQQCEKEAPAFLHTLLTLKLPEQKTRLRIPVIETSVKEAQMEINKTSLQQFVDECIFKVDGHKVAFSDFCQKFLRWLPDEERAFWSPIRIGKEISILKGKSGNNGQLYLGNVSFEPQTVVMKKFKLVKGRLNNT